MKTAIDAAGRIVIPKAIRDRLELSPDVALDIAVRDGVIVIEPTPTPMALEDRTGGVVAVPESDLPPLTAEDVRRALEGTRR
jgi:AbrB family looped-hinge helix DNA binding protein